MLEIWKMALNSDNLRSEYINFNLSLKPKTQQIFSQLQILNPYQLSFRQLQPQGWDCKAVQINISGWCKLKQNLSDLINVNTSHQSWSTCITCLGLYLVIKKSSILKKVQWTQFSGDIILFVRNHWKPEKRTKCANLKVAVIVVNQIRLSPTIFAVAILFLDTLYFCRSHPVTDLDMFRDCKSDGFLNWCIILNKFKLGPFASAIEFHIGV
jgi:hypothetical protein